MSNADDTTPALQVDAHTNAIGFWSRMLALAEEDEKAGDAAGE